ncbi:MAG: hypothetical protein R6U43_07295 [Candidatus Krumholzibacteriales bacterium]
MKRTFILVVLVMIVIPSLLAASNSYKVYYEGNGWAITSIRSGMWLLNAYPEIVTNMKPFRYLAANDPSSITCFVLQIDKGRGLQWLPKTQIVFTYESDGERYSVISKRCFLIDTQEDSGIRWCDEHRYTALPGLENRYFMTPKKEVVMFAKFEFEKYPEKIVSCRILNLNVLGGD